METLRCVADAETSERGVPLRGVAQSLGVTPPTALEWLTTLENLALVTRFRGKSRMTPRGRSTLLEYQRHHRIAESLFGGLGLSPRAVCEAAREVDLSLSHQTVEQLCQAENHPRVCPHGEPIAPCAADRGGR
ncbi:MAG TPA: metal-dependent transcriptional regulator [Thermoplasmata archaeon]|nr:metal-dependent transcriptional regulator [Thermoplasmata archaeon]